MAGKIRSYQDLDVWRHSVDLACLCYERTKQFPPGERYGLTTQIRRSAVSVPSNIAEGYARFQRTEYVHFLRIAHGSLRELETLLYVSKRLGFLDGRDDERFRAEVVQITAMLLGLIRSLNKGKAPARPAMQ